VSERFASFAFASVAVSGVITAVVIAISVTAAIVAIVVVAVSVITAVVVVVVVSECDVASGMEAVAFAVVGVGHALNQTLYYWTEKRVNAKLLHTHSLTHSLIFTHSHTHSVIFTRLERKKTCSKIN